MLIWATVLPVIKCPSPSEIFMAAWGLHCTMWQRAIRKRSCGMRVVDERQINPATVMPGFYADPRRANRVMDEYWDKTILSAQQVEDVIAYLKTLK